MAGKTKIFNGKLYMLRGTYYSKKEAEAAVKKAARGRPYRITKQKPKKGHYQADYDLWVDINDLGRW